MPFAAWILAMAGLEWIGGPAAWKYVFRTVLCCGLFGYLRPWQWYARPVWRQLPAAVAAGVLVFASWVLPETAWMDRWPAVRDFYLTWLVFPLGKLPAYVLDSPYAPERAGWFFSLIRLAGSAFVIAVIEEFFWRGFLYRWMLKRNFLDVAPGQAADWTIVLGLSLAFGLEHDRWFVGALAGLIYLQVYRRSGDLWSAIAAHATTNLLLGIYVLSSGAYRFW
ncbi:MAG: CAAX prenyl protease-related protein [Lentisphaerae bacterium GWF2_57_35]|nr:MAG: CAAX prenyl protease-related protein [Lentisphaerae bacterium GWF2_57_35]